MNESLKISIITVCYNSVEYLEDAVESVLSQDYDNFEYIIIDGGSTDGTLDIIRKYESRLAYWISAPDRGIYDAMNKGIAQASGDIIGMINSDDYYLPGAFRKVANAFADKSLDDNIFWGDIMHGDERVLGWREWNVKRGAFAPHPSMFCPKKVYERIGAYSLDYKILADYDFMYRAINYHHIKHIYLPEPIAFFRPGGLASQNILPSLKEELEVKLRYGQPWLIACTVFLLKIIKNSHKIFKNMIC
ncbi:MAG: glycosyltransferase family 2 protein [Victivallaceae bacterium]